MLEMSIYQGKLLELVSIERTEEEPQIVIKASWFDAERTITWKIDHVTADSLMRIVDNDKGFKYRLSLACKNGNLSTLTKTYRDQSEHIQFVCSEKYADDLMKLKQLQEPADFFQMPFLSFEKEFTHREESPIVTVPGSSRKAPWVSLAMLSIVITVLLGYSSHSFMNESIIHEEQLVKAETVRTEEPVQKVESTTEVLSTTTVEEPTETSNPLDYYLENELSHSLPEGHVALTFDDGPSKYSMEIARILKEHNAGGTFFFIGSNVNKYPEFVSSIHNDGFSIGSHTMHHANLQPLSTAEQESEIVTSIELIQGITNEDVLLFRPPYGSKNDITIEIMEKYRHKMVLWNKDPKDWKTHNPEAIINYVKNSGASGSIILLHESQEVVHALPALLNHFKEQNLKVVNLK